MYAAMKVRTIRNCNSIYVWRLQVTSRGLRSISFFFFALLVLCFSQTLSGQAVNATLLGTIIDSSGATVANAKVVAIETATAAVHELVTNESGNYTFPDLPPGQYTVTVEAKGFKRASQENITLLSNSSVRIDFSLKTGSVSETVVVTEAPPLLQTDRADISTKIEAVDVVDMPLGANRNFQSLLNVVPGAAPVTFQHSQFFNAASALQTEVNGMPREGTLYQIEGIDDNERTGVLQLIVPPAEAIASVDISTNNFEPELGRATGAVTNVTLKSGTNRFHGSAFEFNQNNAVDARSYFASGPLGPLHYNYFGGALGGPILKDKFFFFGDYLHSTDHEATSNVFTIPDARLFTPNADGNIDLSGTYYDSGAGQIYDPATGDGQTTHRTPFENNQIPMSRVNPVSLTVLKDIAEAAPKYGTVDTTQPLNNLSNNFSENLPFTKTTDSFDTKLDFSPNEKSHVSGRYSFQRVITYQAAAFGPFLGGPGGGSVGAEGFQGTGNQTAYSSGINVDHVFSPSFYTEVRFGVAHLGNTAHNSDYGTDDATQLGIPGVNIPKVDPFSTGQVGITVAGFDQLTGYYASMPWIRVESNIDFVNNWTKVVRNRTFKWGTNIRRVHDDLLTDVTYGGRGAYYFDAAQTSDSNAIAEGTGNSIASFLLDQPDEVGRDLNTFFPKYRQWWIFGFAGDKWQATPKMTVDLGLRWDFYPPATPVVAGGFANYDPATNNIVLAGVGGNPSNLGMQTRYRYFSPRTGISYRLRNNTVLRAGFGISYMPFQNSTYAYNYPIRANNSYLPTGNSAYTPAVLADGVTVPHSSWVFRRRFRLQFPAMESYPPTRICCSTRLTTTSPRISRMIPRIHGMSRCSKLYPGVFRSRLPTWQITARTFRQPKTSTCLVLMAVAQLPSRRIYCLAAAPPPTNTSSASHRIMSRCRLNLQSAFQTGSPSRQDSPGARG
jgi:hypothetical protein